MPVLRDFLLLNFYTCLEVYLREEDLFGMVFKPFLSGFKFFFDKRAIVGAVGGSVGVEEDEFVGVDEGVEGFIC